MVGSCWFLIGIPTGLYKVRKPVSGHILCSNSFGPSGHHRRAHGRGSMYGAQAWGSCLVGRCSNNRCIPTPLGLGIPSKHDMTVRCMTAIRCHGSQGAPMECPVSSPSATEAGCGVGTLDPDFSFRAALGFLVPVGRLKHVSAVFLVHKASSRRWKFYRTMQC